MTNSMKNNDKQNEKRQHTEFLTNNDKQNEKRQQTITNSDKQ